MLRVQSHSLGTGEERESQKLIPAAPSPPRGGTKFQSGIKTFLLFTRKRYILTWVCCQAQGKALKAKCPSSSWKWKGKSKGLDKNKRDFVLGKALI